MRYYLTFELRRLARDTRFLVLTVLTPLAMYMLFSSLAISGNGPEAVESRTLQMVGMASYAALMVTITNGGNIAADRALGWIAQLRTTPIGIRGITVAKMASGLLLALPTVVCVYLVGAFIQHVELSAWGWIEVVVITWLGSLPFALLGLAVGYASTPQSAGPSVMAATLGLAALGGLWIPAKLFPSTLRHISEVLPSSGWADITQRIALGHAFRPMDLLVLAVWAVAFAGLAALAYRRNTVR